LPPSGNLAHDGTVPTMIQWEGGGHPSEFLPDVGCRLETLLLHHPEAPATLHLLSTAGLDPKEPIRATREGRGVSVHIRTPGGIVALGE